MKTNIIVAAAAVAVAAALNSAWLMEGSSSNCAAVEQLAARQTVANLKAGGASPNAIWMARGFAAASNGRIIAQAAAEKYRGVPTPIACAGLYWWGQSQGGAANNRKSNP